MRRATKLAAALLLMTLPAPHVSAQSTGQIPPGFVLSPSGVVNRATVTDVLVRTESDIGPYTAFLVRPPNSGATAEWFYVRNDNSVKALERGTIVGMLLGAAEGREWSGIHDIKVNIEYHSVGNRKEIIAVSLVKSLKAPV